MKYKRICISNTHLKGWVHTNETSYLIYNMVFAWSMFDLFIQFRSSINFEIQSRLHQKIHHDSEVDEVDLRQDFEQVNRKSVVLLIPFFPAVNYVLRTVDNWVDWHLYRKEKIPIKLVKQHMSSPTVFIGVRVTRSLIFCVMHWIPFVCHFGLFVTIVLSVLRFTDSD
jgi:hypothetical protein